MNKNRYRIVYNKARQMFMAVAENVKSQSKTSGQGTISTKVEQSKPFHQLWQVKCLIASMSVWMPMAPVYAQIQADGTAIAANRPVIGVGKNSQGQNVPVVNIQTPTNGVSRNVYKQLDVLEEGVVLNNSRTGANSSIVGTVGANPFLAQGEARIILNEVNSSTASRFEGNLEIAGQRADVIIANPAGINIKGSGFINANKVIFTTGKPQLNTDGSIQEFIVDQGKITVSANTGSNLGLGGNNNNADYVDLYTRALELNAQLYANKDIQAITGANSISADLEKITTRTGTGTAPTLAIDVKNLGSMYANNIYLMGNEKGLGVSNAGIIRAVNNLIVTSAGKIEHTGTLESTSNTQGIISIQTTQTDENGNINSRGTITSKSMLSIDSGNNLNITGNQIIVNQGLPSPLLLSAVGDINLNNGAIIKNVQTDGDIYLNAQNINIGENSQIVNVGTVNLNAKASFDIKKSAQVKATNDLNIVAKQNLKSVDANLVAEKGNINLQSDSNTESEGNITLQGTTLDLTKNVNINGTGNINLSGLDFTLLNGSSKLQNINAYSGMNLTWDQTTKALPQISGNLILEAASLIDVKGSSLSSQGDLKLQGKILNIGTNLNSGKSLSLTATQSDLNLNKTLNAQDNIDVTSLDGKLTATGLNATSTQGKISILGSKDTIFTNAETIKTTLKGNQGLTIGTVGTGNLTVQNVIFESQNGGIVTTSVGKNTLADSTLIAKDNIEIFAKDNLTLDGIQSTSQQHTALNSKKNIYINSQATSTDVTDFGSTKNTTINTKGILSLVSENNQDLQNIKLTGGAILVESGGGLNTPKAIELNAVGSDLLKNDSKLSSLNGNLSIQSKDSLTIDPTIHTLKAVGDIELASKGGTLTLAGYGGAAGNGSEKILNLTTSGGGISLEGASINVQGTQLNAHKDINLVSTQNNLIIDGVKNIFKVKPSENNVTELKNEINIYNEINLKIKSQEYMNDYVNLLKLFNENYGNIISINVKNVSDSSFIQAYKNFLKKYPVRNYAGDIFFYRIPRPRSNSPAPIDPKNQFREIYDIAFFNNLNEDINFFSNNLNGYEHIESTFKTNTGNISINSAKGISISGANLSAKAGQVNVEAQGVLDQQYTSAITKAVNGQPTQMAASIIIDGHTDFYDKGDENSANYSMRTLVSPTVINGDKGVNIRATGKTNQDNLILQATGITSANGDIRIEANKSILFDAAVEQSYNRSTQTETKKSWGGLKKKTITTVAENNDVSAASVEISGKNIFIESKEKNIANNIDIYSGKLTADGGQVSILSGGNINLYTVQESSTSNVDITKKSSFAGIKYNKSNTTSTRSQISELPGVLKADYIGVKADNDIRLVGTEFEYLQGAKIEAGRTLSLLKASTTITETLKKEKNSVVWQSMQDKGSVTETAQLPHFNGPTLPEFKADGGLVVQIPIGEKDQNKVQLRDEILKLANQPGNEYLKELVNRKDVNWQQVLLTQKDWDYKSQGLTGAGAAIIIIVVTIVTMGSGTAAAAGAAGGAATSGTTVGLGASMIGTAGVTTTAAGAIVPSTLGAMANAAVTSLATQASVSLINNGGDIGKTLKDLGSKDSVKNLATGVITAGLLNGVATNLNISSNASVNNIANHMATGMIEGVGSTLINSAVNGGNLSDGLEKALLAGLANSLQAPLASVIGDTLSMSNNAFVSKVVAIAAHAAAGCATGVVDNQCQSRALGAALGEVIAENMFKPANGIEYTEAEKLKILNITKLSTGVVAAYAGYDVTAAANAADTAVNNNYLSHAQEKQKNQEFKDCKGIACSSVTLKWAGISAGQDGSYASGFAAGIPTSIAESVVDLAKMALSPIQTYNAIKEIINNENALGNISDAIKQDYINRINKMESEYQKAGAKGSYNAGLEAGKLTTDVASLLAGGAGLAKGGAILTEKITVRLVTKTQDVVEMALKKSVVNKVINNDRIGSGLKPDPTHIGASFLNYEQLMKGQFFKIKGGDGIERTLLQVEGGFNDKKGIFEYIVDNKGKITHQRFIANGRITGIPNQTPPKVK